MNAPDSTPTVREAGDEGIAAVLAAGWSDQWANRPNDHVFDGLADALAPLIAEREADAWERGHEVCEWPACLKNHHNPYRAALAPETPEAGQ